MNRTVPSQCHAARLGRDLPLRQPKPPYSARTRGVGTFGCRFPRTRPSGPKKNVGQVSRGPNIHWPFQFPNPPPPQRIPPVNETADEMPLPEAETNGRAATDGQAKPKDRNRRTSKREAAQQNIAGLIGQAESSDAQPTISRTRRMTW